MNLIVANLLFHADEVISFWLFKILIEEFNLGDNYVNGI